MTENMKRNEELDYLTYEQLNDENKINKNVYRFKAKRYKDGSYKLYRYANERIKCGKILSSSVTSDGNIDWAYWESDTTEPSECNIDYEVAEDDTSEATEQELKEYKQKHLWAIKRKLSDYARNNDFDMFWTLTFDNNKVSTDDKYRFIEMGKWLRKMRDKYSRFRYIAIPERHKSGAIHWHMISGGLNPDLVDSGVKRKGAIVYNSKDWEYGFTDVQKVRSKAKVANYITKYLTKELVNSPAQSGKKKYWSSKGLSLPGVNYSNDDLDNFDLGEADFESEIVKIYELSADDVERLGIEDLLNVSE